MYSRTLQKIYETKKIIIINHKNANEILEKSEKEKPENVLFLTQLLSIYGHMYRM